MEFDNDRCARPDSKAIATTSVGGYHTDGSPWVFTNAAVCDVCGNWATQLWTSGKTTTATDDIFNSRILRRVEVIAYSCTDHSQQVADSLVDEFGHASNLYEPDELALAVHRAWELRWVAEKKGSPPFVTSEITGGT